RMRRLVGLLFLMVAASYAENRTTTTVSPIDKGEKKACALYCFITPEKTEKVDFSLYKNLSCTHFVYGFGDVSSDLQLRGPSMHDEPTHSYPGNFHYLRSVKSSNPTSSLLLGVHLNQRDSIVSSPHSRKKLASSLLQSIRDLHLDGIFLRVDRPFIDNSRFARFFEDMASLNSSLSIVLGVPLPLVSHSLPHLLDSHQYVQAVCLMSTPSLDKIAQLDPLLPSATTPPEQTISYHAKALAAKGVPKRKIIIGLSASSVVYKNYLQDSLREEAEGRLAPLQETCGTTGEMTVDKATASQMVKTGNTWIASNAPTEQTMGRKVRWLTSAGYGGIGLQSLSHDDPKGNCSSIKGGAFPLLRITAANMECTEPSAYPKGCTRLCYINSMEKLEHLAPTACSHVVVEATLTVLGEVKLTPEGEATAKWIRAWHTDNKPMLVISLGARQTSDIWRIALSVQFTRNAIIAQLQALLTEWKAGGVEVSWTLGPLDFPTDASNLDSLLLEMRQKYGKDTALFLAVTHGSTYKGQYKSMARMNTTVDRIVLHSHRFHSSRQPFTGHHSPLFYNSEILPEAKHTVEGLVAEWVSHGMSRSKIIVGITAQPLSMSLIGQDRADSSPYGMVALPSTVPNPAFRAADGDMTATNGKKVCELEKEPESRLEFIADLAVPFLVNKNQFVAYESERSVQMKTTWISLNQLGGVALFDAQLDNPEGGCTLPFPLLNTIVKTQMCERCVRVDDVTPCDSAFTISCSYRLPTASEHRPMPSDRIPFESCTQIVVEEVILKEDGTVHFRDETAQKAMKELASLKPTVGMKRLIASVRCEMTQEAFDDILKNGPSTVSSLLSFVSNYSLSGFELRCDHLVDPPEKLAFASLLKGLRSSLIESTPVMKCPHSLSLRLPIWKLDLTDSYDISFLNEVQHVVLEPFNDPPKELTAHVNSPLFSSNGHKYDIDTTIQSWAKSGLDKAKIILQIPAYATLQNITSNVTEIGAAASLSRVINQAQVCSILKQSGSQSKMMWDRIATYAVTDKHEWMSMQNQETIAYKIFYAIREGLGGMGLLSLNEDDWESKCGSGAFPLLTAAKARCPHL
ncbi:hypothetical protein PFISCL1PPCAC_17273, partial [Pristionchus fissidentatus]